MLRWLAPDTGDRHFYRIAEMVFDVPQDSVVTPDLDRIPRTALPPAALVVLFSPLLDERAIGAVTDLRERGFSLIVVDVLRYEPPASQRSDFSGLALRLWRLDRGALRARLADLAVPVVVWDTGDDLGVGLVRCAGYPSRQDGHESGHRRGGRDHAGHSRFDYAETVARPGWCRRAACPG